MTPNPTRARTGQKKVDVIEPGQRARQGAAPLVLDRDITFSTRALETYAFASWEEVVYDAMVLAAAIEFADRTVNRPPRGWHRELSLRIPVHDVDRWRHPSVREALDDALRFLTGDAWSISFVKRRRGALAPSQDFLQLPVKTEVVIPYSDGMDSLAVVGLLGAPLEGRLVRVRLGSKACDEPAKQRRPFARVPYQVACPSSRETSARSRGFKFALITSIAAYLADAKAVVLPESGQGSIGPALLRVGHAWPDYRNHPSFTVRMERFVAALFGKDIRYDFPRIWHTKGETLREFVAITKSSDWRATRSCWRSSRWSSVNGSLRQCGVCAACMLRRVAVHAAGLQEPPETYVCFDLQAERLSDAFDRSFAQRTRAYRNYRDYAIAGVRYMDDLADMARDHSQPDVRVHAAHLAPLLGIEQAEAAQRLQRMLHAHAEEWFTFMKSLGPRSFAARWIR